MLTIILQAKGGFMEQAGAFLPLVLLFVVFYFFFIRPQTKRQKQEKNFQDDISKGTRIVTTSGIHGKIAEIMDDGPEKLKLKNLQYHVNYLWLDIRKMYLLRSKNYS